MKQTIEDNKFVELTYRVIDQKTGHVLTTVEFPLGYVHGVNGVLAPQVMAELEGKSAGDTISVPIDCTNALTPPRVCSHTTCVAVTSPRPPGRTPPTAAR